MLRQSVGDRILTFGNLLQFIGGKISSGIAYLLRDEFTTDQASPITTPRTCEPGPGTLTRTQTGGITASIESSALRLVGTSPGTATLVDATARTISNGLCVAAKQTKMTGGGGGIALASQNNAGAPSFFTTNQFVFGEGGNNTITGITFVNPTGVFHVARNPGAYGILRKAGVYTIEYISNQTISVYSGRVASDGSAGGTPDFIFDNMTVYQLSAPWITQFGLADSYTASPVDGAVGTHQQQCWVELTWTPAGGETMEMSVRRADDNNRYILRCSQAGSTIKLIEVNSGVETERSSAAQTWTTGTAHRVFMKVLSGSFVSITRTTGASARKNTYSSTSLNSNTGAKVAGFTTAIDFAIWPYTLSATQYAELDLMAV